MMPLSLKCYKILFLTFEMQLWYLITSLRTWKIRISIRWIAPIAHYWSNRGPLVWTWEGIIGTWPSYLIVDNTVILTYGIWVYASPSASHGLRTWHHHPTRPHFLLLSHIITLFSYLLKEINRSLFHLEQVLLWWGHESAAPWFTSIIVWKCLFVL